jgi:plastocyanin
MFFSSRLTALGALLSLAVIPVVRAAQINVTVGGPDTIKYTPDFVTANVGDVVVFTFQQKNHTATQSTFQSPCSPMPGGFDSGFIPVSVNNTSGPFPQAQFIVQDTNPVWVYCRQTGHCQQGMVFAINPGTQFAAFQAAAMGNSTAATTTAAAALSTATATLTAGGETVTTTYGSFPGSAAPTAAVSTDHQVVVGGTGKLFYSPSNITAQPGDTVTFQFQVKNHTVTQSSFNTPCRSLTSTSTTGQIGFDSGFMPVSENATTFPTYTIQINNTAPIWVYCRQTGHCGQGMVFSVNAVESGPNNFEAFKALAEQQNGTATATSATATSTSHSGASHVRAAGWAVAAGAVAAFIL